MKVSLNKHVFQTDVFMKNYKKVGLYLKEVAVNEQSIRILLLRIFLFVRGIKTYSKFV